MNCEAPGNQWPTSSARERRHGLALDDIYPAGQRGRAVSSLGFMG
jgi:hypothetical protein